MDASIYITYNPVYSDKKEISDSLDMKGRRWNTEETFLEVAEMPCILIVVGASGVSTTVKTHRIVLCGWMQFTA